VDKQILKQRIVGAIVLVGLAVIFIPMILSGGKDSMPLFGSNIPDKPKKLEQLKSVEMPARAEIPEQVSKRIPIDENTSPEVNEKLLEPKSSSTSKEKKSAEKKRKQEQKKTEQEKPAKAWAVQVGSFAQRDNAMKLRDKLRKNKYPAFVELVKSKDGKVYRVRVGPDVTRTLAEKRMQNLRDKMKIYGVVMRHP